MKRSKPAAPAEPPSDSPEDLILAKLQKVQKKRDVYRFIVPLVVVAAVVAVLFGLVLGLAHVQGSSMLPSLYDGEWVLIWHPNGAYARGDIVAFTPKNADPAVVKGELVKRVIGLPGETVDIRDGQVLINGAPLDEPLISQTTVQKPDGMTFPYVLKADEYFVLGDNRGDSYDSRNFGPVTKGEIAGRVILSLRFLSRAANSAGQ